MNLYLDAVKRGWSYTFVYMLRDSNRQGYWGFVRPNYSYKASANYLHNLTTILADKPSTFILGKFNYSISNQSSAVHDLLMQKSDGTLELAVWGEMAKDSADVTVNFGAKHKSVKIYDPTVGIDPIRTFANVDAVPLTLSDHPFIVAIDSPKQ